MAIVGNFALTGNQTMAARALPLARLMVARGCSVRMALPVRTGDDVAGIEKRDGLEICQVGRGIPLGPLGYVWQILWMAHLCFWWRPSVVYCFKPIAHSGVILALFLALRRAGLYGGRVVLDTDDWEGDGGWNEKQPFPGWLKALVSRQERWALSHADILTAASLELVKLATEAGARRVYYLPNCLDCDHEPLAEGDDSAFLARLGTGKAPLVLVYTRFVEYRVDRLLITFEKILQRKPEAVFIVAGSGLNGEEHELRAEAARRGLERSIRILGWVHPEKLRALFAAVAVALYPMDNNLLNRTKCPVKMAQLVSAGVPVVSDRVGQASEYILDGETGILVDPGDADNMAQAAFALMEDPERRGRMSQAAREYASRRLRWAAWFHVLEKALGTSP